MYFYSKKFLLIINESPLTELWEWISEWSPCSASCGNNGHRSRDRICIGGTCYVGQNDTVFETCSADNSCFVQLELVAIAELLAETNISFTLVLCYLLYV